MEIGEATHIEFERRAHKAVNKRHAKGWAALLVFLLVPLPIVRGQEPQKATTAQSEGKKVFEGLKSLAGVWQGTIMGIQMTFTLRAASSGTTLLLEGHAEAGTPPNHEITVLYFEGDRLLATHYCDNGSRSRFDAKMSADAQRIDLSFVDVTSTRGGYLKDMAFTVIDANRQTIEGTFVMPDGKQVPMRGDFQRTK